MSYKSRQKKRDRKALERAERTPQAPTRGVKVNGKSSGRAFAQPRRRRNGPVTVRRIEP